MENGIEFRDWELFPKPVDVDTVLEEDATLDPAAVSPSLSFLDFCAVAGAGANMSIRVLCLFTPLDTATVLAFSTVVSVVVVSLGADVTWFSVRVVTTEL